MLRLAMREDKTAGLTPNCVLIRSEGFESQITDSAAPHQKHKEKYTEKEK
jgi:hypothetical protein